ncbi:MAG: GAF domain-containing protein [Deltaproteobacteria bacterium]|nr:GAF domain-containing protein [Deltaproteobacteria bacterium]
MKFELTIPDAANQAPPTLVRVEATNWMAALQLALERVGSASIPKGKAVCDLREDGTILVRNVTDGREFYIRPLSVQTEVIEVVSPTPSNGPTVHGTMTYLEAQLQDAGLRPAVHQTSELTPVGARPVRHVKTAGHPCMVFDRAEIEDRLRQQRDLCAASGLPVSPGPVPSGDTPVPGQERPVHFIRVVDVPQGKKDTLASLKVDLDALRRASKGTAGPDAGPPRAPAGFGWLDDPLDSALRRAGTLGEMADRTLRLALAALPSRIALLALADGSPDRLKVVAAIGERAHRLTGRLLAEDGMLLSLVSKLGASLVLDNLPSQELCTDLLAPLLGATPQNALLAALTSGESTSGALVLADSLTSNRFLPADLAVANYIAGRLHCALKR